MRFLHLTLLYCVLNIISPSTTFEYPRSSSTKISKPITTLATRTNNVVPRATNILFQSTDGGATWQDISQGLPVDEQPERFFAGGSDVYMRINDEIYRSKSNLETPVWEKEVGIDPRSSSIVFSLSGAMAFDYDGQIFKKTFSAPTWLPAYTNPTKRRVQNIFETSDGTILVGSDDGLYKSIDSGKTWKQMQHEGWGMDIVEFEGVLMATGQKGIRRSTDNGEHWQWIISEGGVGIAIERINGGFAAITYNTTTKTRRVRISLDRGQTWKAIDEGLPPSSMISSIKQMGGYLICGHPNGIVRSSDMGKTWNVVHPSITKNQFDKVARIVRVSFDQKVFKIWASGNVLYAVAVDGGC
jgi:photosystem II stability/assembly factor-like uncharacterized protein